MVSRLFCSVQGSHPFHTQLGSLLGRMEIETVASFWPNPTNDVGCKWVVIDAFLCLCGCPIQCGQICSPTGDYSALRWSVCETGNMSVSGSVSDCLNASFPLDAPEVVASWFSKVLTLRGGSFLVGLTLL